MYTLPIVLIGPLAAGKSTIAHTLSTRLGIRQVPVDAICFYYYLRQGCDFTELQQISKYSDIAQYLKPFDIVVAESVVFEFSNSIIDFGACHAHFTNPEHIVRLENTLVRVPNVFLLTPSLEPDRATQICRERVNARPTIYWDPSRADLVSELVRSECFRRVSKHIITTDGRSVEESVDELIKLLV